MTTPSLLTVAIPAYNRPDELGALLKSILAQDFMDAEVLVVEDHSPRREEIGAVVDAAARAHPTRAVRFHSNEVNLGYDKNVRRILELSQGAFTLFMGDDDLLCPGALTHVARVLSAHANLGVILRAYETIDLHSGARLQLFRYFEDDRFFPAGAATIRTFFRRSVSIAGYTVHTQSARACATDRFDGTLLYQLHLSAQVLKARDGYFISDVLTSMRKDEAQRHFFGTADAERGLYAPGALTPEHSLNFMRGMLRVARAAQEDTGLDLYDSILADLGNYSYAFLRLHAEDKRVFAAYVRALAGLGLWRSKYFWAYAAALCVVPVPLLDQGIAALKRVLPATPILGKLYTGERVRH